jgi:hypothetical protein
MVNVTEFKQLQNESSARARMPDTDPRQQVYIEPGTIPGNGNIPGLTR